MKKYLIPLMVGLLLAIGGDAGTNVLTPLIQSNMADDGSISSNNFNTFQNGTTNTTSGNNSSINQSNSSTSDQNMTEIINDSQAQSYGDSSKTWDIIMGIQLF